MSNYINESLGYKNLILAGGFGAITSVTVPHGYKHFWAAHDLNRPSVHEHTQGEREANVCVLLNLKEIHVFETMPRDLCARPTL